MLQGEALIGWVVNIFGREVGTVNWRCVRVWKMLGFTRLGLECGKRSTGWLLWDNRVSWKNEGNVQHIYQQVTSTNKQKLFDVMGNQLASVMSAFILQLFDRESMLRGMCMCDWNFPVPCDLDIDKA